MAGHFGIFGGVATASLASLPPRAAGPAATFIHRIWIPLDSRSTVLLLWGAPRRSGPWHGFAGLFATTSAHGGAPSASTGVASSAWAYGGASSSWKLRYLGRRALVRLDRRSQNRQPGWPGGSLCPSFASVFLLVSYARHVGNDTAVREQPTTCGRQRTHGNRTVGRKNGWHRGLPGGTAYGCVRALSPGVNSLHVGSGRTNSLLRAGGHHPGDPTGMAVQAAFTRLSTPGLSEIDIA